MSSDHLQQDHTNQYRIGDVYLMEFDGIGSEQSGVRPGVIFQNNKGNAFSPNIIALPLSQATKKMRMPTHVMLSAKTYGLPMDSIVLCENPQRMSKQRIIRKITHLPDCAMREIAIASLLASSALSFLTIDELADVWRRAVSLNSFPDRMQQ